MVSYILLSTTIKSGNSLLFDGSSNHPPGCNVPPLLRSTKSTALKFSDSSSGVPTLDERESVSSYRVMVVLQYGSALLINVPMKLSLISTCLLQYLSSFTMNNPSLDVVLDYASRLMQGSISVYRLNSFRHILEESNVSSTPRVCPIQPDSDIGEELAEEKGRSPMKSPKD
ncbi:hypothetical protein Bca4012_093011 [Brassica carinata]|uniref:Uncharacterized protein n=1 Tax=Brassica carinata TaxID=52824 RepID=A0A8X7PSJ3_BRACI|nr:hypothetical protein Bca52824_075251 [Brassica carinata]